MQLPNIQIGSDTLDDALLASVEVTQELNQHWWCTLAFRQTADLPIRVEDYLAKALEISVTDDAGATQTLFAGLVYSVSRDSEIWGSGGAEVRAVSASYLLDTTQRKQYYKDGTLSSVAAAIAGRTGLKVEVNAGSSKPLNYVQYDETDFAFLHRMVDDYGAWMRPSGAGLEVFTTFQAGGSVAWREEQGLLDFSLRGRVGPATFGGAHYNHHTMESQTFQKVSLKPALYDSVSAMTSAVQAASAGLPPGFEPHRSRAMTLEDYEAQLGAESERSMGSAVTVTGRSRNQILTAGNTVNVTGDLDAAGTYGLVKVLHSWRPSGYENVFLATPWKAYRNPQPPAMRPGIGMVPASVVGHDDPKKMGRLRVQYHWQEDSSAHWARMVTPNAGPDRGFMFMPEIGDEVAVGFEDGDTERPVIMGSLWNGVQQAPRDGYYGAADVASNDVKRLVTKSGNRWHIADTLNREAMTLATPNHTYMTLSEQYSATGRPMLLLHSDGDIVFSAPGGRVHLQSAFHSKQVGEYVPLGFAVLPDSVVQAMDKAGRMKYRADLIAAGRAKAAGMPAGAARSALEKNSADFEKSVNQAEMAHIAADVYREPSDPDLLKNPLEGWKRVDPKDIPDPSLQDPQLWRNTQDHFRSQLYQSTVDPSKYTVGVAGSLPQDFGTDAKQAFGLETAQYNDAIKLGQKLNESPYIQNLVQQNDLQGTGHSLGGGLGVVTGTLAHIPTTTMNAAGVHPETLAQAGLTPADVTTVTNLEVPGQVVGVLQSSGANALLLPGHLPLLAGQDIGTATVNAATRSGNALQNAYNSITGQPQVPLPTLQKYPANQTWRTVFPAAGKQVILPDPGPATSGVFKKVHDVAPMLGGLAIVDPIADSVRRHLMEAVETSIELNKTAERTAIEAAVK